MASRSAPRSRDTGETSRASGPAIYVGGAFKARSLVKALRHLGMNTALVGSQTGTRRITRTFAAFATRHDHRRRLQSAGALAVSSGERATSFIGGVKERPIAHKLGIGFCDHNHERKVPLAGFEGMVNFARELHASAMSPVWRFTPRAKRMAPCMRRSPDERA